MNRLITIVDNCSTFNSFFGDLYIYGIDEPKIYSEHKPKSSTGPVRSLGRFNVDHHLVVVERRRFEIRKVVHFPLQ